MEQCWESARVPQSRQQQNLNTFICMLCLIAEDQNKYPESTYAERDFISLVDDK